MFSLPCFLLSLTRSYTPSSHFTSIVKSLFDPKKHPQNIISLHIKYKYLTRTIILLADIYYDLFIFIRLHKNCFCFCFSSLFSLLRVFSFFPFLLVFNILIFYQTINIPTYFVCLFLAFFCLISLLLPLKTYKNITYKYSFIFPFTLSFVTYCSVA